jgi:hypothetical protein
MIYSKLPANQYINQSTPRSSFSPRSHMSDEQPSYIRHRHVAEREIPPKDGLMDFEGILYTCSAIEFKFAQLPVDFGIESTFRVCKLLLTEKQETPGGIMKDELVALIQDIDAKAAVKMKPSQDDIVDRFMKEIESSDHATGGPFVNALQFSQMCKLIEDMQKHSNLGNLELSIEQLASKFRDQIGFGSFNISRFRVQSFLSAFPNRPAEALGELETGKMFAPRSRQDHFLTEVNLWSFLKQLAMPQHVFSTALAMGINSVAELIDYINQKLTSNIALICYHFCICRLFAQRLVHMSSKKLDDRVCRSFCLLPRHFVYEEFIAFYHACDECTVSDDGIEASAYQFSKLVSDERGVSRLSLFEMRELLQMHRMWPGAAIKDINFGAADSFCGSIPPLSVGKVLVRVGLEIYEHIFEALDVQTVQDLKDLDIDVIKKTFPEFSLDWDACKMLEKLNNPAKNEDFIFNAYAPMDFETCKNILELHLANSTTCFKSSTTINSFYGTSDASTAFAIFLSKGNFSQFQLSSFLNMHPGREAWVTSFKDRSDAYFLFADHQNSDNTNAMKFPNFFSPDPVRSFVFDIGRTFAQKLTLYTQVRRDEISLKSMAKRFASSLPSNTEQENMGVLEMYEILSKQKLGAAYSKDALIQKRFALLHCRHIYNCVMKVSASTQAKTTLFFSNSLFADVFPPI